MRVYELRNLLAALPESQQHSVVLFEVVEEGKEPDTSFGIDEIVISDSFVVLISVD